VLDKSALYGSSQVFVVDVGFAACGGKAHIHHKHRRVAAGDEES